MANHDQSKVKTENGVSGPANPLRHSSHIRMETLLPGDSKVWKEAFEKLFIKKEWKITRQDEDDVADFLLNKINL